MEPRGRSGDDDGPLLDDDALPRAVSVAPVSVSILVPGIGRGGKRKAEGGKQGENGNESFHGVSLVWGWVLLSWFLIKGPTLPDPVLFNMGSRGSGEASLSK